MASLIYNFTRRKFGQIVALKPRPTFLYLFKGKFAKEFLNYLPHSQFLQSFHFLEDHLIFVVVIIKNSKWIDDLCIHKSSLIISNVLWVSVFIFCFLFRNLKWSSKSKYLQPLILCINT